MKRLLFYFLLLFLSFNGMAQDNMGAISIFPIIMNDDIPAEAMRNLSNTMSKIISESGFGSVSYAERVILSANMDVVGNSVSPTNPPRVCKKIRITFTIGDIVENKLFSSCSVYLNGIGLNDTKAYISAFSLLSSTNMEIKTMIKQSQCAIISYYGQASSSFISNAKAMAMNGDINKAIAYLMSIPPINEQCFTECQTYAVELYTTSQENANYSLLSSAKAAWVTDKSRVGASRACYYLKQIQASAKCFSEALLLWDEISDKLDADDKAAKLEADRQYNDKLSLKKQEMKNRQESKMALIDACKAIGTAFGNHQPQNIQKNIIRGWL